MENKKSPCAICQGKDLHEFLARGSAILVCEDHVKEMNEFADSHREFGNYVATHAVKLPAECEVSYEGMPDESSKKEIKVNFVKKSEPIENDNLDMTKYWRGVNERMNPVDSVKEASEKIHNAKDVATTDRVYAKIGQALINYWDLLRDELDADIVRAMEIPVRDGGEFFPTWYLVDFADIISLQMTRNRNTRVHG